MKKIIACGDSSGEELVKGYPSFRGEWCVEYSRGGLAYPRHMWLYGDW
jgi:hypothetical protein